MNEFDKLRQLWPDRQIFQGSAGAYIRYCESWQLHWEGFEKPLWTDLFQNLNLKEACVVDMGSGTGKLVDTLIENGAKPENIFALEPNPILIEYLFNRQLGIGCIRDSAYNLKNPIAQKLEADMITANMVMNHLTTPDFNELVSDINGVLKQDGLLVYTVPNPYRKQQKHSFEDNDNFGVAIENAPWGGLVEYHHRTEDYQKNVLNDAGFNQSFTFGSYDETHHMHIGPMRMMVIAQKK